ncbi:MAG: hypothetical protein S4CHLAM27_12750 [Chlamydiia bacterium]|nr:hypothetical protein [Chlamydiia bacterium]
MLQASSLMWCKKKHVEFARPDFVTSAKDVIACNYTKKKTLKAQDISIMFALEKTLKNEQFYNLPDFL